MMDAQDQTEAGGGPRPAEPAEATFPLMEGWMLLAVLFPEAMAEVVRVPPANDPR